MEVPLKNPAPRRTLSAGKAGQGALENVLLRFTLGDVEVDSSYTQRLAVLVALYPPMPVQPAHPLGVQNAELVFKFVGSLRVQVSFGAAQNVCVVLMKHAGQKSRVTAVKTARSQSKQFFLFGRPVLLSAAHLQFPQSHARRLERKIKALLKGFHKL